MSVYLLDQGADVNVQAASGYTPYKVTTSWSGRNMDILKEILVARGAIQYRSKLPGMGKPYKEGFFELLGLKLDAKYQLFKNLLQRNKVSP